MGRPRKDAWREKYKAQADYKKRTAKYVSIQFHKEHDKPLIEKLESVPSKSGYIKDLIKRDIDKGNK